MVHLVGILFGCFNNGMQISFIYWLMIMQKIGFGRTTTHHFSSSLSPKCQPITVEQCKDLPYNETR